MHHVNISRHKGFFKPLLKSKGVQAAVMVLKPGQSSGDEIENEHSRSEQWLYVISGSGVMRNPTRALKIKTGSLVLIEKKEPHQVVNTGRRPLVTLNFYALLAYTDDGEVILAVKGQSK